MLYISWGVSLWPVQKSCICSSSEPTIYFLGTVLWSTGGMCHLQHERFDICQTISSKRWWSGTAAGVRCTRSLAVRKPGTSELWASMLTASSILFSWMYLTVLESFVHCLHWQIWGRASSMFRQMAGTSVFLNLGSKKQNTNEYSYSLTRDLFEVLHLS